MFSGRGIIPLEAARLGVIAVGTDLSPVATLGGRLLADYPLRDWSDEPALPFQSTQRRGRRRALPTSERAPPPCDVRAVLSARSIPGWRRRWRPFYPRSDEWQGPVGVPVGGDDSLRPVQAPVPAGRLARASPFPYGDATTTTGSLCTSRSRVTHWHTEVIDGDSGSGADLLRSGRPQGQERPLPVPDCRHVHCLDPSRPRASPGSIGDALLAVGGGNDQSRQDRSVPRPQKSRGRRLRRSQPVSRRSGSLSRRPGRAHSAGQRRHDRGPAATATAPTAIS